MPDLQKPIRQMEQRLGEVSREVLRIEAHIRRGEPRAAQARIAGVRDQVESLQNDSNTPLQLAAVGAQLGLMSGSGSWLRGRIPGALVCGIGGWMYGQSVLNTHARELDDLLEHLDYLEEHITAPDPATGNKEPSPSS